MAKIKIIQITTAVVNQYAVSEGRAVVSGQIVQLIGLGEDGNTYFWDYSTGTWNLNKKPEETVEEVSDEQ